MDNDLRSNQEEEGGKRKEERGKRKEEFLPIYVSAREHVLLNINFFVLNQEEERGKRNF